MFKHNLDWRISRAYQKEWLEQKMPSIIFWSLLIGVLISLPLTLRYAMKLQARKDCLITAQYDKDYPNYVVSPQMSEMCGEKFNINFTP